VSIPTIITISTTRTDAPRAVGLPGADIAAEAAVAGVEQQVDAAAVLVVAGPIGAEWGLCRTDPSAGAAVVGIRQQRSAYPVAVAGPREASVLAPSRNTGPVFVGTRLVTLIAAGTAVEDVTFEICAAVGAAISAYASTDCIARPAGVETLRLLVFIAAFANGFASVLPGCRGGLQPQRTEESTSENSPKAAQRFAAGNGFR
jgi:hypothetical protein